MNTELENEIRAVREKLEAAAREARISFSSSVFMKQSSFLFST